MVGTVRANACIYCLPAYPSPAATHRRNRISVEKTTCPRKDFQSEIASGNRILVKILTLEKSWLNWLSPLKRAQRHPVPSGTGWPDSTASASLKRRRSVMYAELKKGRGLLLNLEEKESRCNTRPTDEKIPLEKIDSPSFNIRTLFCVSYFFDLPSNSPPADRNCPKMYSKSFLCTKCNKRHSEGLYVRKWSFDCGATA